MRNKKVDDNDLLAGLMSVLRARGYDGSTLNELADATGLQKASLYHRFPGGKKEITDTVLDYVEDWVSLNVHLVLANKLQKIESRLDRLLGNLRLLYDEGSEICILRSLTLDGSLALFGPKIKNIIDIWLKGFYQIGIEYGDSKSEAKQKAMQSLVLIQGSLMVGNALNTIEPFQRALLAIKKMYS